MKWKAIIFDLDGVICSTDEFHYQAWKALADGINVPFDRKKNNRLRGVARMECLEILLENSGLDFSQSKKEALAAEKNDAYVALLARMSPADLTDEVMAALEEIHGMGLKLAIGSSSKNARLILRQIGLSDYFDAISDGNNITKSKPDPEVFLKAAAMLGLPPEACLVVEDAVAGAEAARAGGMCAACVGDAAEKKAGDFNMNSLTELPAIILSRQ